MGNKLGMAQLLYKRAPQRSGNCVELLRCGAEFFPALIQAIESAQSEICLQTYTFALDDTALAVRAALCKAAERGVVVKLVIDGFGSLETIVEHEKVLAKTKVQLRVFRREGWFFHPNPRRLRRMHRKLVVVDRQIAFVGGINVVDDNNQEQEQETLRELKEKVNEVSRANANLLKGDLGPRYDFAVRLQGPVVHDVWLATEWLWWRLSSKGNMPDTSRMKRWSGRAHDLRQILSEQAHAKPPAVQGKARVQFLVRDNLRFRRTIEKAYLKALGEARESVLIANAYFLPGRRVRRALKEATRRGVKVRVLLQGRVEYRFQHYATMALYSEMLKSGVEIHEYLRSFLHAKVAVIDGHWATVGSSNLDPLSMLVAREANVVIDDKTFAAELAESVNHAIASEARQIKLEQHAQRPLTERFYSWVCYRLLKLSLLLTGFAQRY
ncbi:MAG: cardiolipin synthase ClsB [Limnobacter sp.]|nr:cardiolipin synthase ClsB [Limnobacter sp.]